VAANGADEIEPVVAQVRFTADERDLFDAELRHLADQVESLCSVELVWARAARARAAVATGEITSQRDLPDRVNRASLGVDGADAGREGEVAPRWEGVRRQRQ
jgi:hypothetical protein